MLAKSTQLRFMWERAGERWRKSPKKMSCELPFKDFWMDRDFTRRKMLRTFENKFKNLFETKENLSLGLAREESIKGRRRNGFSSSLKSEMSSFVGYSDLAFCLVY